MKIGKLLGRLWAGTIFLIICGCFAYLITYRYYSALEFKKNIRTGEPLVRAILGYKRDFGIYPDRLDDLMPDRLSEIPAGWTYDLNRPDSLRPPLLSFDGPFHAHLSYHFDPRRDDQPAEVEKLGWWMFEAHKSTYLGKVLPQPDRVVPPAQERDKRLLRELERRVRASHQTDRGLLANFRRWIAFLVEHDRLADALESSRMCINELPNEPWPRMAEADLGMRNGDEKPLKSFEAWARKEPSFRAWSGLALVNRLHNRPNQAIEAYREAAKQPIPYTYREGSALADLALDTARFAYIRQENNLAIALCDSIRNFDQQYIHPIRVPERLVRSASLLRLGKLAQAIDQAAEVVNRHRPGEIDPAEAKKLLEAARAGDQTYEYPFKNETSTETLYPNPID